MTRARASFPWLAAAATITVGSLVTPADAADQPPAYALVRSDRDAAGDAVARSDRNLIDPDAMEIDCGGLHWRLGGYVTADATARGRHFESDGRYRTSIGDARPVIDAWNDDFMIHIEGDAIGVDTPRNLYEAWAAWTPSPAVRVSVGQFRVALGSEFGTHEKDLPFIGYGFSSYIDGRYDTGLRVDGTPVEGLWYQAAAVTGHGFTLEGDRMTSPQGSVRAVVAPFRLGDRDAASSGGLHGFYLGAAYAHRTDADDPLVVTNPLQSPVIVSPDLDGTSADWVHLDVGWSMGPVQIGLERAWGRIRAVPVPGGTTDLDNLGAYSWFAAWNLTGESRGWRDGTWTTETHPGGAREREFPPAGRWELAARFSNVNIHRDLFNAGILERGGGGNPGSHGSTWQSNTYTLALFWEISDNLRVGVEGLKTVTEDRMSIFGGTKRDTSFVLRVEFGF